MFYLRISVFLNFYIATRFDTTLPSKGERAMFAYCFLCLKYLAC